jgi:Fe-coproporphyrin III synthase
MAVVYSSLKALRFPERLSALAEGRLAAPAHVRIKPTNVCNHSCYFCAYRNDGLSLGEGMVVRDRIPREKMREIVEDLVAMQVAAVTFSGGGEPLLYPHLVETIEALAAGGVRIGALTNASRLTGRAAEAFAAHGTWLRVSIDGWDGRSYARYRRVREDEFERVLANLAAFAARGSACALGASMIVDADNAAHVAELCRKLKDCGVGHVKLSACILRDSGAENNAYHAPLRDVVRRQLEQARALEDGCFRLVDHYHAFAERFDKPYRSCPFARLLTVIGADCAVYLCQDKAYTAGGRLGSIRERRFRDFWFSEANERALAAVDPARACRHHCVADAKNRLLTEYLELDPAHAGFV